MCWSLTNLSAKLLLALLLVLAVPAQAVDGGACDSYTNARKGDFEDVCLYLCDGNKSAASDCPEINLGTLTGGFPHHYTVLIEKEDGCAGTPEVTPRGLSVAAGTTHDLVVEALTTAGTSSKDFPVTHKFVDVALADVGSCTDLEVFLILWYTRK